MLCVFKQLPERAASNLTWHTYCPPFSYLNGHRMETRGEEKQWESEPSWDFSDDGTGGSSGHGGHWEKSLGWLLFILERSGALTRWERNGRRHIQSVPACPQVLQGHDWKRKSKLYQVMLVPWWQCPEIAPTHYLWNFSAVGAGGAGETKSLFLCNPKSHLTFYNPFSSLGRGKKRERRWERQERKPKD